MTSRIETPSPDVDTRLTAPTTNPQPTSRLANIRWLPTWILLFSLAATLASLLTLTTRSNQGFFVPTLATLTCILAALFDGFTTRIPNPLTYTALLLGLALNALASFILAQPHINIPQEPVVVTFLAAPGIYQSLIALAVTFPFALVGLLFNVGGGDLKLILALAALLGLSQLGAVLLIALAVALVYGIINLLLLGGLNSVMRTIAMRGLELVYLRRLSPLDAEKPLPGRHVPMAIPLAIALITAQILTLQGLLTKGGPT
jgi:prepilin signal peptidase PulO-like enzyme (type II secretory pathway)